MRCGSSRPRTPPTPLHATGRSSRPVSSSPSFRWRSSTGRSSASARSSHAPRPSAAWAGWPSFALPAPLARRLTFSTFEGRPRYADDVELCVPTPACDVGFSAQEIGHVVTLLVPPWEETGGADVSLYARVAAALADRGADALAASVRALSDSEDIGRLGGELAFEAGLTELVAESELVAA